MGKLTSGKSVFTEETRINRIELGRLFGDVYSVALVRFLLIGLVVASLVFALRDNNAGAWLCVVGGIISVLWSYVGFRRANIAIDVQPGVPLSYFVIHNKGTEDIRGLKIVCPPVARNLQRDFDEVPQILVPNARHRIRAGLGYDSPRQFVFEASWRSRWLGRTKRQITATRP